jgi:pimeloyl-ACP methyl ester carboxylesterase
MDRPTLPVMRSEPILFVHGFASSFERNWREPGWIDLVQEAGRTVIGPDVLGHGTAEKPHDPAAYADLEQCLVPYLPADGPCDAIGFSMGGQLLLKLAAQMPERFGRIVIGGVGESAMADSDREAVAYAIESGDSSGEGGTLARAFAQFGAGSDNDPKALAAMMRRPGQPLTPAALANVTVPVLLVIGDRDFTGSAQPLADALPNAKLTVVRGVDHFGLPKHFGFIDAALNFLDAMT